MTKIGEGKEPAPKLSRADYCKELNANMQKFQNALRSYQSADTEEKEHLKGVMDQALGLIKSAVNGLKEPGMGKREAQVEKDYKKYMEETTLDNYSTLQEDVSALKESSPEG